MLFTVPVVSAILSMPPIIVEVEANNWRQATRMAKHHAQFEEHIPAPVVPVTEREQAMENFRYAQEHARHIVRAGNLNGRPVAWWRRSPGLMAVACNPEFYKN